MSVAAAGAEVIRHILVVGEVCGVGQLDGGVFIMVLLDVVSLGMIKSVSQCEGEALYGG